MTCSRIELDAAFHRGYVASSASCYVEVERLRRQVTYWKQQRESSAAYERMLRDKLTKQVTLLRERLGELIDEVTNADDALSSGDKTKALIGVRRASVSASYGKQILDATEGLKP